MTDLFDAARDRARASTSAARSLVPLIAGEMKVTRRDLNDAMVPYDVAFRHQQALDPSALTTLVGALHAVNTAIEDCRNAGVPFDADPGVLLLARHLGHIAGAGADDMLLKRRCQEKIAELKQHPALATLAIRGVAYDAVAKDLFHSEGKAALHRLSYRRLLSEPLIAVVPGHWSEGELPPLRSGRLHPAEIAGTPLVMFPRQSAPALHDLVTDYLSAQGGLPRIAQEAIQMQTIISLVSAGMGIALVPASLRKLARSDVRYIDLAEDSPCLEIGLAWRADDLTPALQRFLSIVGELQP